MPKDFLKSSMPAPVTIWARAAKGIDAKTATIRKAIRKAGPAQVPRANIERLARMLCTEFITLFLFNLVSRPLDFDSLTTGIITALPVESHTHHVQCVVISPQADRGPA